MRFSALSLKIRVFKNQPLEKSGFFLDADILIGWSIVSQPLVVHQTCFTITSPFGVAFTGEGVGHVNTTSMSIARLLVQQTFVDV